MTEVSTFLQIPYPSEGQDPFYDTYLSQVEALDQVIFMNKLQNNLFVGGGGIIGFTPSSGLLYWTEDFVVPVFHFGKKMSIPYGPLGSIENPIRNTTILDGYAIVLNIPYTMTGNVSVSMQVLSQLTPLNHQQWVMAWRLGTKVYFKGMNSVG
jgi:hypothetical protein